MSAASLWLIGAMLAQGVLVLASITVLLYSAHPA